MTDPRYPIGAFVYDGPMTADQRDQAISSIDDAPAVLRTAVTGLTQAQLDTPYRPGGWTVRQVVHHVPDSHMNAYVRTRLALTEDQPTITPYDEARWAELPDARDAPIEPSLTLLESLHQRWVALLRALPPEAFEKTLIHPDWPAPMSIDKLVALYAWHGRHHVAHVTGAPVRK